MDRWEGKVAVVTGASAGIGAAIVRDLVKAGMTVVGLARRVDRVEAIAAELSSTTSKGKLYAHKCDVTKEDDVVRAFAWVKSTLGGVDVLVNNAGTGRTTGLTTEGNTEALRLVLDTNVWGLVIATREAVNSMRERNVAGHVIHINRQFLTFRNTALTKQYLSVAGHGVPSFPGLNIYPATKYAVTALTESLRHELRHLNTQIKVTSISPGAVETEIFEVSGNTLDIVKASPKLQPEDVSQAVIYALGTPPHVQVHELRIKPVGAIF